MYINHSSSNPQTLKDRTSGAKISVLGSGVVDCGLEPNRSDQTRLKFVSVASPLTTHY